MDNRILRCVPALLFGGILLLFVVRASHGQEVAKPTVPPVAPKAVPEVQSPTQPPENGHKEPTPKATVPKVESKSPDETAPAPKTVPQVQPPAQPKVIQPSDEDRQDLPSKTTQTKPEDETPPLPTTADRERDDWLDPNNMLASRGPIVRLASVPNMFGDGAGNLIRMCDFSGCGAVSIPPPGGGRGAAKISDNDKAMPMDRVFFSYNHFHNALETFASGSTIGSYPIDQYTIGAEKTFNDGQSSLELRLPLRTMPNYETSEFSADSGEMGNLVVTWKRLLLLTENTAVAAGLGIDMPTGSDISGQGIASSYKIHNDAVHLSPFLGFLTVPNKRCFFQGFLQVDVATNDNEIVFGGNYLGKLHDQTLLYLDLSVGYWLYRNTCARLITGVAPIIEYHYTSTLQDADVVSGSDGYQLLSYGAMYNRMDISNLTAGLHTELGKTTVRVGGVFPLGMDSHRAFDAEVQLSINRRF